ncbi:hypothetical protein HanRHA438_Chr15g0719401 [Helianthus annuus]|nr:hypothetical protein HanIR_Chr15g0769271 [Helianthus annuus]KAJ0845947.1 hypothetical protein HanRHA438_Chr15g0719401 [Helianthus annuus]
MPVFVFVRLVYRPSFMPPYANYCYQPLHLWACQNGVRLLFSEYFIKMVIGLVKFGETDEL